MNWGSTVAVTVLLRQLRTLVGASLAIAVLAAVPAHAGDAHDHDRARRAVEAGEVLPLQTILERVARDYPGQVMEVELEQKGDRWVYEIKVLRAGGTLVKLKIDGRDGRLLDDARQSGHGGRHRVEPQ
jgi:uncharacterized membrane protein YkoI